MPLYYTEDKPFLFTLGIPLNNAWALHTYKNSAEAGSALATSLPPRHPNH